MSKTPTAVLFHNLINRGGLHFEEPAGRAPQRHIAGARTPPCRESSTGMRNIS